MFTTNKLQPINFGSNKDDRYAEIIISLDD